MGFFMPGFCNYPGPGWLYKQIGEWFFPAEWCIFINNAKIAWKAYKNQALPGRK
jgi:hypothetical protein